MKTSTRWYRAPRIALAMDAACAAWLDERCPLPNSDGYEVAWAHTRNVKPPTDEEWQRAIAEYNAFLRGEIPCPPPP